MPAIETAADVMMTWTKAGVIAEALSSFGIVATLFYSVWSFRTTLRDAYYAELDREYFELLKISLERPDLLIYPTSPAPTDPARVREYAAYAFMVWNFLETIFDRCQGWFKQRLRDTWYPIIDAENALHRQWFDLPENRRKFKASFVRFIDAEFPRPAASPSASAHEPGPSAASAG
jgi:hypothetical protein